MNMASSRSHCIFTVSIESRVAGSDTIKRSKLHLVDLAGSERVHKTNAGGQILREAKYINTSLHFLEMCIVALQERGSRGRVHIPYRNSKLTLLMQAALAPRSRVCMFVHVTQDKAHSSESLCSLNFAERCSSVQIRARNKLMGIVQSSPDGKARPQSPGMFGE